MQMILFHRCSIHRNLLKLSLGEIFLFHHSIHKIVSINNVALYHQIRWLIRNNNFLINLSLITHHITHERSITVRKKSKNLSKLNRSIKETQLFGVTYGKLRFFDYFYKYRKLNCSSHHQTSGEKIYRPHTYLCRNAVKFSSTKDRNVVINFSFQLFFLKPSSSTLIFGSDFYKLKLFFLFTRQKY